MRESSHEVLSRGSAPQATYMFWFHSHNIPTLTSFILVTSNSQDDFHFRTAQQWLPFGPTGSQSRSVAQMPRCSQWCGACDAIEEGYHRFSIHSIRQLCHPRRAGRNLPCPNSILEHTSKSAGHCHVWYFNDVILDFMRIYQLHGLKVVQ